MRTVGIICEYNPFHSGHKRQIDILRDMGYECVVCVMSGNYTQRGELAIFDKYTRARSAILGGADIILELPFPYSSFSAEGFAESGVHILLSLGVDAICFGSECGDISVLERAANAVLSDKFSKVYSELANSGIGSAAAYFEAIKEISLDDISLCSNDILGISYITAVKKAKSKIRIIPIKRNGSAYKEKKLSPDILPSASAIRESIKKGCSALEKIDGFIPSPSLDALICAESQGLAPVISDNIGSEILSFFKLMSPQEIASRAILRSDGGDCVLEDGCGICSRLCNTARQSRSFQEFISSSYTSKYTDARINRVLLFSLIGVSDKLSHTVPEFTTLLAANDVGRSFLSNIRKSCELQIVTKPADSPNGIQKLMGEAADSLYAQAIPVKMDSDFFVKCHPFMLK